ncbi:Uncharacterised protein [Mycobacteroides abscessus subsp. abscessus]|nr:Uncharacterised protein [Mycobacteroides abscessus subsp. abscessus]
MAMMARKVGISSSRPRNSLPLVVACSSITRSRPGYTWESAATTRPGSAANSPPLRRRKVWPRSPTGDPRTAPVIVSSGA